MTAASLQTNLIDHPLVRAGQAANAAAAKNVLREHMIRKSDATKTRYQNDLHVFADFLAACGLAAGDLYEDPEAWRGVTWGLIEAFRNWMIGDGYAMGSVNDRLMTVKLFAKLATKAGAIDAQELTMIQLVRGYTDLEAARIDEERKRAGIDTRHGTKRNGNKARRKSSPTSLTAGQAAQLKVQPDTPRGRRDALIMCLFLDHGLRRGEVAGLMVESFDLEKGLMTFYRKKVNKWQTHQLTADTLAALRAYLAIHPLASGPLILQTFHHGARRQDITELCKKGMGASGIEVRVRTLGANIGIASLSPHDCRHYWATLAAHSGTQLSDLRDAGGWSSLVTPSRYIHEGEIANEGVILTGRRAAP